MQSRLVFTLVTILFSLLMTACGQGYNPDAGISESLSLVQDPESTSPPLKENNIILRQEFSGGMRPANSVYRTTLDYYADGTVISKYSDGTSKSARVIGVDLAQAMYKMINSSTLLGPAKLIKVDGYPVSCDGGNRFTSVFIKGQKVTLSEFQDCNGFYVHPLLHPNTAIALNVANSAELQFLRNLYEYSKNLSTVSYFVSQLVGI